MPGSHTSLTGWRLSNWVSAGWGGKTFPEKAQPFSENFPIGYFGRPDHDPYPALD